MKPRICCHKEASFIKFQVNMAGQTSPKLLHKMFKKTQKQTHKEKETREKRQQQ